MRLIQGIAAWLVGAGVFLALGVPALAEAGKTTGYYVDVGSREAPVTAYGPKKVARANPCL